MEITLSIEKIIMLISLFGEERAKKANWITSLNLPPITPHVCEIFEIVEGRL